MPFPKYLEDPELAVASGELVPARNLPHTFSIYFPSAGSDDSLDSIPPPVPPKDRGPKALPYNSFLIPKGSKRLSLPKAEKLSEWAKFQLWFNTYR